MMKTKTVRKAKPRTNIKNCRVADIGISNMAECLKSGPCSCSYAVPFGYCFLCKHPRLNEIMENTRKAQLAVP